MRNNLIFIFLIFLLTNKNSLCYNLLVRWNIGVQKYPSPVEGTGLENQEAGQLARGFESLFLRHLIC